MTALGTARCRPATSSRRRTVGTSACRSLSILLPFSCSRDFHDGAVKDARAPEAAGSRYPRAGSALEACTRITGALLAHGRTKMLPKASSAG